MTRFNYQAIFIGHFHENGFDCFSNGIVSPDVPLFHPTLNQITEVVVEAEKQLEVLQAQLVDVVSLLFRLLIVAIIVGDVGRVVRSHYGFGGAPIRRLVVIGFVGRRIEINGNNWKRMFSLATTATHNVTKKTERKRGSSINDVTRFFIYLIPIFFLCITNAFIGTEILDA